MKKKTIRLLSDLQSEFYRAVFNMSQSCPLPILFFDTKGLLMEHRIWKKKLLFLFHLENLPRNSLGYEIYLQQKTHQLPGLVQECQDIISQLGLKNPKEYNKTQWKRAVTEAIDQKNHQDLLIMIKPYKKLSYEQLKKEEYEVKPYQKKLSLQEARTRMRIRAQMLNSVKTNFQSDPAFAKVNYKCGCGMVDSQRHIEQICTLYDDLRCDLITEDDQSLVKFFDAVLKRRQDDEDKNT